MIHTDTLKDAISIHDLISRYMKLERSGTNYKGLCPFHGEKTPSFYVTPSKLRYHCFGCEKNGDIITFVQEMETLSFVEAVEHLCSTYGIIRETIITDEHDTSEGSTKLKKRLIEIHKLSTEFYQYHIAHEPAIIDYIKKRGIHKETLIEFAIGYADPGKNSLAQFLLKKGYSEKECIDSGLIIKGNYGSFDRFSERIMFPLRNYQGDIVGFSGRIFVLPGSKTDSIKTGKYINSPETDIYKKNQILFGFSLAKKNVLKKDRIIMMEGQIDVVLAHQYGFKETIAISGTALSEYHIQKISPLTQNVFICLDGDKAGIKATLRSIKLLFEANMNIMVVGLPLGQDPADIMLSLGEGFSEFIDASKEIIEYICSSYETLGFKNNQQEKKNFLFEYIFPYINHIIDPVTLDLHYKKIAKILGLEIPHVMLYLKSFRTSHYQKEEVGESVSEKEKPMHEKFPMSSYEKLKTLMFMYI